MYSIDTLRKVMMDARDLFDRYTVMNTKDIRLCVSKGNRKIGRVLNVSLMPIMTCGKRCKYCKGICYDIKACVQYKNVLDARVRNTVLAIHHRQEYFDRIEGIISRRRANKYFRWHVAGDILDYNYFENMVRIAKNHPDFTFWTYTKQYEIVNSYCEQNGGASAIPGNLSIMFSEWKVSDGVGNYTVIPFENPYNFPVFAVRFHGEAEPENMYKCPGNCDVCKTLGRGCPFRESAYVDEH